MALTDASRSTTRTGDDGPAKKKRASKYNKREAIAGYLFISPWIIGFLVFTLGAMLYSLFISFSNYNLATNSATRPPKKAAMRHRLLMRPRRLPRQ